LTTSTDQFRPDGVVPEPPEVRVGTLFSTSAMFWTVFAAIDVTPGPP
jgi:hypothetical protein